MLLAQSDPVATVPAVVAAVITLIGLLISFMKLSGENNTRVDNITAAQITQLREAAKTAETGESAAYHARDKALEEAERWRQKYEAERATTAELRTEVAVLKVMRGTAPPNAG
jgi:uncharacterized protein (DUF3084 family)